MSDEIERLLSRPTPRGAPPALRDRVLAAVAEELDAARPRRRFSPSLAAAAAVLVALASNYLASEAVDRRLAVALGPRVPQKRAAEIAADVASLTDPATGRWAYERLTAAGDRDEEVRRYADRLQKMIQLSTFDLDSTGADDEAPPKNPQMDRDLHGGRDRRPPAAQYVLRLEHRQTA
jgi:hypothetical protein